MGLPNSFARPHVLTTKDLDEAKKWIGIPDEFFQTGKLTPRPAPAPLRAMLQPTAVGTVAPAAPLKFTAAEHDVIREAAVSYIWGNSASVAKYKPIVEQQFVEFQFPIWVFLTITVSAGSTLLLGPGNNIICCWQITIEEGGTIVGVGGLSVQCTILQKVPAPVVGGGGFGGGGGGGFVGGGPVPPGGGRHLE
jgi:hypothetical protein